MGKDPLLAMVERKGSGYDGFEQLGSHLWQVRTELGLLASLGATFLALDLAVRDPVLAGAILCAVVMVLLGGRWSRDRVRLALEASRIRRRWAAAVRDCGFPRSLPITDVERVEGGLRARVRVGRGVSFNHLERDREELAACLRVRELRVKRDAHDASTGTVTLIKDDPLMGMAGTTWPGAEGIPPVLRVPRPARGLWGSRGEDGSGWLTGDATSLIPSVGPSSPRAGPSLWRPIPVGIDEHGERRSIVLPERNLLLGGIPGSGKSAAMSLMLATAALDPTVQIYLIDGKMVEFAEWEDCAVGVGHTLDNAINVLTRLQALMLQRYQTLRQLGLRKVPENGVLEDAGGLAPGDDLSLIVLFVDELALFMSSGNPKGNKEFTVLITDLVARGRAAGVIVVAATQKPEGTVISTNLRDLFAYRWALACGTPQASDTILGQGWAARGYNAALIPIGEAGTGYLLAEDGMPTRLRTFYLNDDDIRALAARAKEVRAR